MKVTVYGSHQCSDTLYAINVLCSHGAEVNFKDILSCHYVLLDWLEIRRTSPLYDEIRNIRRLGMPCIVMEDGFMTLDVNEVLKKIAE